MTTISIDGCNEYDIQDIADALECEGYQVADVGDEIIEGGIAEHLSNLPPYELRDLFCDMVGVNHHTPKDELMKLLSEKI
jgi:hypothetical protein